MNRKIISAIVDLIIKESMPMAVMEPTRSMSADILRALRSSFGIEAVEKPIWREYITVREGESHNKMHYFVVFKIDDDTYVAANAYGRIGYNPKVVDLGEFKTKEQALAVAKKKLSGKLAKGYKVTPLN